MPEPFLFGVLSRGATRTRDTETKSPSGPTIGHNEHIVQCFFFFIYLFKVDGTVQCQSISVTRDPLQPHPGLVPSPFALKQPKTKSIEALPNASWTNR